MGWGASARACVKPSLPGGWASCPATGGCSITLRGWRTSCSRGSGSPTRSTTPIPPAGAVTPIKSSARAPARQRGPRAGRRTTLILVHGLLLAQTMHAPLARDLAARGNRVVTVDLLGHGESERPRDMWRYSMRFFADQVVALMDHLEVERAVVMGTSLGANTALEIALESPERLQGMVIEMPVLDNALLSSALTFTPILVALTFGEPVMKLVARGARAIPRAAAAPLRQRAAGHGPPGTGPGRGGVAGPLLRARRAASQRAAHVPDAGAGDRPPARPRAPLLRRGDARRGAAQRRACWRPTRWSSCASARSG